MFYVSKISTYFFILGFLNLFLSLYYKYQEILLNTAIISVFGFILSIILGGLYQIFPNSQNVKLKYEKLSYIVLTLLIFSTVSFVLNQIKIAGFLILFGISIFLFQIFTTLKTIKPLTIRFIFAGILNLFLSILFLNLYLYSNILTLKLSIHTFTLGVLLNLVMGVQFAWIPMLTMKVLNLKLAEKVFYLYQFSVLMTITAFFYGDYSLIALSGFLILTGVFSFLYTIYTSVFKGGKILNIPVVIKYFLTAWLILVIGGGIGVYLASFADFNLIFYHVNLMIYGFAYLTILGGILHLLQRIIWNLKYIEKAREGKEVPQISKMIDENYALLYLKIFIILFISSFILELLNFKNLSVLIIGYLVLSSLFLFKSVFRFYFID
jgi:hypothetical protein